MKKMMMLIGAACRAEAFCVGLALFGAVQAWGATYSQMTLTHVASSAVPGDQYSASKLFDNDSNTKWCNETTTDGSNWVEFTASAGVPSRLALVAANDTSSYPSRNWKSWSLQGWNGSSWETIKTWSNESPTKTWGVATTYDFSNTKAYPKYKVVLHAIASGNQHQQMADLKLYTDTSRSSATVDCSSWAMVRANLVAGNSVKLTQDITQDNKSIVELTGTQDVTLDLNGRTITQGYWGDAAAYVFQCSTGSAKVTIKDSAGGGAIVGNPDVKTIGGNGGGGFYFAGSSSLTLESGTLKNFRLESASLNGGCIYVNTGASFTMNGGMITNCTASKDGGAVYNAGTVTMNGGVLIGNKASGSSTSASAIIYNNGGTATVNGGVSDNSHIGDFKASGKSCTQVGTKYIVGTGIAFDANNQLTAGTYTFNPTNAEYVAAGVAVKEGKFIVREASTTPAGYQISDGNYVMASTWAQVRANLLAGNDVKLANHMTVDATNAEVSGKRTLDMNGKVVSVPSSVRAFCLQGSQQLTVTGNGTFTRSGTGSYGYSGCVFGLGSSSKLIFMNGTISNLTCADSSGGGGAVCVANSATFEMNGGTISGCSATGVGGGAVYVQASTATFTMNGGTITGCTASKDGGAVYNNGTFTMNGGVLIGNKANGSSTSASAIIYNYGGTATVNGGVSDNSHIGDFKASGKSCTQVGTKYIVGTGIASDANNQLTAGTYTFNPTNAEYVAAGVVDASKVAATGSGTSYTLKATGAVECSDWAQVRGNLMAGNSVKLAANVTQDSGAITLADSKTATLDLAGFVLKATSGSAVTLGANSNLTLTNSNETATHYFTVGSNGLWTWNDDNKTGAVAYETLTARPAENAIIAIKGGCITGAPGSGIYQNLGSTLVINGGTIVGNGNSNTLGGGVYQISGGASYLTLNAGRVCGNRCNGHGAGFYAHGDGTFTINGGDIAFNTAVWVGGGICSGYINLNGGRISWNSCGTADGHGGGGIYTRKTIIMTGGEIVGNTTTLHGGGVNALGTFEMTGGIISNCTAATNGGAICLESSGTFTMNGGVLIGNKANGSTTSASAIIYTNGGTATVNGGVSDNSHIGDFKATGKSCTQVGTKYIVGTDIAFHVNNKLIAGTYTFCPTNAEYAAAGVALASGSSTQKTGELEWQIVSGTSAGDNVRAYLADGVCTVYGTGVTANENPLSAQWASVKDVRIADGVTGLGTYFFYKFHNLTNVTIAASCTSLGEGALFRCLSLEQVTFEGSSLPTLGENALPVRAAIKMNGDTPVVTMVPKVTVGGKEPTLKGSTNLTDWVSVEAGNEGDYHFFKYVIGD